MRGLLTSVIAGAILGLTYAMGSAFPTSQYPLVALIVLVVASLLLLIVRKRDYDDGYHDGRDGQ